MAMAIGAKPPRPETATAEVPSRAAGEHQPAHPSAEPSQTWMTAADVIRLVAREEPRLFELDAATRPEPDGAELHPAAGTVTRAVRDERLAAYGHRTIDGHTDPSVVAEKLHSTLFLGGWMICRDGTVKSAVAGDVASPIFDRVHFRRAEVLSLWRERLPPDVARPDEPSWITNARKRAQVRGQHARHFAEKQCLTRRWVSFAAIADWCARECGSIKPDEELRSAAYEQLRSALVFGAFDVGGKSCVLFFGDNVSWVRMTRERFAQIEHCFDREIVCHGFLGPCWIPHELAGRWFAERNLVRPLHLFPPVAGEIATGQRVSRAAHAPTDLAPSARDDRTVRRRKAPSGVNYEALDAPLVLEMREMIVSGQVKSPWEAALVVSEKAGGDGNGESKAKRLHGRYSVAFSAERD